jgi:hypothetical protein
MILISGYSLRILRIVSNPSCSGIMISVITMSGCSLRSRIMAHAPSAAAVYIVAAIAEDLGSM